MLIDLRLVPRSEPGTRARVSEKPVVHELFIGAGDVVPLGEQNDVIVDISREKPPFRPKD